MRSANMRLQLSGRRCKMDESLPTFAIQLSIYHLFLRGHFGTPDIKDRAPEDIDDLRWDE